MAAVGREDLTLAERPPADATAATAQRLWCARNMIAFASDVPKHTHLPALLANLHAPVATLRHVAAAALHQLSSTNLGAPAQHTAQHTAHSRHEHIDAWRPMCVRLGAAGTPTLLLAACLTPRCSRQPYTPRASP